MTADDRATELVAGPQADLAEARPEVEHGARSDDGPVEHAGRNRDVGAEAVVRGDLVIRRPAPDHRHQRRGLRGLLGRSLRRDQRNDELDRTRSWSVDPRLERFGDRGCAGSHVELPTGPIGLRSDDVAALVAQELGVEDRA